MPPNQKTIKKNQIARLRNQSYRAGVLTQEFKSQPEFKRVGLATAQAPRGSRGIYNVLLK